jgi:hypothetical protein
MSTTSKEDEKKPEWGQWGQGGKDPKIKEYIELLMKFNEQQLEILKDTRNWLTQNGNNSQ